MAAGWRVKDSIELYGIERWGNGFFTANAAGNLAVRPAPGSGKFADVKRIVEEVLATGLQPPLLVRFPQLIRSRVAELYQAFAKARKEYSYTGRLRGVFPMKVNQERNVIQEVLRASGGRDYGLEVGSKPELLAAVALKDPKRGLLVCNGFKDVDFIRLACEASLIHEGVVIVADRLVEVADIVEQLRASGGRASIGIRVKLHSRGGGRWVESGGDLSKFGLTVPEVMKAIDALRSARMLGRLRMLHFHVGSQITDIRRIHSAVREATRIYTELVALGAKIRLLNCGGGLGIDYEGSQSTAPMSVNYGMQEYANTLVYTVKSVCDQAGVAVPDLVTESGRGVSGYHALLVVDVVSNSGRPPKDAGAITVTKKDPRPLVELAGLLAEIGPKNHLEIFHDALTNRDDLLDLFNLGRCDLNARSRGEEIFRAICQRAITLLEASGDLDDYDEDWKQLRRLVATKYVANYSMFQSTPDVLWVRQLFPVLPLHRLDEKPTEVGTLADLTCDSDGEMKRFIDVRSTKDVLELHTPNGKPYYLCVAMLGSYQDVLGSFHNLFGAVHEVFVTVARNGTWRVDTIVPGGTATNMLTYMNYEIDDLVKRMRMLVRNGGPKKPARALRGFSAAYKRMLEDYTYLRR